MSLEFALGMAQSLVEVLAPACERIEIAGGVRRRKVEPNDIEIVSDLAIWGSGSVGTTGPVGALVSNWPSSTGAGTMGRWTCSRWSRRAHGA